MHALLTEEQVDLGSTAKSVAQNLGLKNPSDLDDRNLQDGWSSLADLGFLGLRLREDGVPSGSGVDLMVITEALGASLVPQAFIPSAVGAAELLAVAGAPSEWSDRLASGEDTYALLLRSDMRGIAESDDQGAFAWGSSQSQFVLAIDSEGGSRVLRRHEIASDLSKTGSIDLTQPLWKRPELGSTTNVGPLGANDETKCEALILSSLCADTVGLMRQALMGAVEYSKDRIAYGVPVGSFQAIQHMSAESLVLVEGAAGATSYAAWCVDAETASNALLAARTAKSYTASIARTVTENVMQIYGGIGQTWEHIAHFYTRRALLNTQLFGNEEVQLDEIAATRLGGK